MFKIPMRRPRLLKGESSQQWFDRMAKLVCGKDIAVSRTLRPMELAWEMRAERDGQWWSVLSDTPLDYQRGRRSIGRREAWICLWLLRGSIRRERWAA